MSTRKGIRHVGIKRILERLAGRYRGFMSEQECQIQAKCELGSMLMQAREAGAKIEDISRILGHTNTATTRMLIHKAYERQGRIEPVQRYCDPLNEYELNELADGCNRSLDMIRLSEAQGYHGA